MVIKRVKSELVQIQESTVKDCVVLLVEDIPIYRPSSPSHVLHCFLSRAA
jgi:hypothetical protein